MCAALGVLVDGVEPVKIYARNSQQPGITQLSALTGLADCARPESEVARRFAEAVNRLVENGNGAADENDAKRAHDALVSWRNAGSYVVDHAATAGARVSNEAVPVASNLLSVATIGSQALEYVQSRQKPPVSWATSARATLANASKPSPTAVELPMLGAIAMLVEAATR
jgi:hypothetical protein